MNKDLTVGSPSAVLWRFCIPLLGSIIFQQLYNLADSFVAGKFIGEDALAAVGNGYEITLIFIAFAFGSNVGCSVIMSQLFGARRYNDMKTAVYTTLISGSILCTVLLTTGLVLCSELLALIHTPDNIFGDSMLYLNIYILGFPFVFFYNIATGIFSALGDSKTPFWFLAFSSVANIITDIIFVTVFDMGVSGVAWATFLCQGISCVLSIIVVFRRFRTIKTQGKVPVFSKEIFISIASIAVPSILQQSFISVGNIMLQGIINSFGSAVTAGYSAGVKLNNLVVTSFTTLGNGISNYTAQNLGAEKYTRVGEGFREGLKIAWTVALPFALIYIIFPVDIIYFFIDGPSATAVDVGVEYLRIIAPFYIVSATKLTSDGVLRGAGMMKQFMAGTFTDLILRVILAKILSPYLGPTGIWISWPVGWIISTIMSIMFYRSGKWRSSGA